MVTNKSGGILDQIVLSYLSGNRTITLREFSPDIQLFKEGCRKKMCTRHSRKVIWDTINSLFLTL